MPASTTRDVPGRREQQLFQRLVAQALRQRPAERGTTGAAQVLAHRGRTQVQAGRDLAPRQAAGIEPQHISDLPHRQSLRRHPRTSEKVPG